MPSLILVGVGRMVSAGFVIEAASSRLTTGSFLWGMQALFQVHDPAFE